MIEAPFGASGEGARALVDVLVCPRCRGALEGATSTLSCSKCRFQYPRVGNIPVLVADPGRLQARFRALARDFDARMSGALLELLAQIHGGTPLPRTRRRLETLHRHLGLHQRRVLDVMTRAGIEPAEVEPPPAATSGADVGAGLLDYYPQIHRDWGWDATENHEAVEALDAVGEVVGARSLGRFLVLGAGACRLTQDLHHRFGATLSVALDLNPLPFLVAARLLAGETVSLYEFPPWPLDSSHPFVERTLRSPWPPDPRIALLFADGLEPPVRSGSVDTILTPWFVDQAPSDMRALFARIWELLPVGGRFLNFGPLIYREEHTELPQRYCVDEVLELVERSGFRIERESFRRMPYMQSPSSCQGRVETVLTFSAERLPERPPWVVEEKPVWLADPSLPVPRLPLFVNHRPEHPLFAAILALIDGTRSAGSIAETLAERHGLPRHAAEPALLGFLESLLRSSQATAMFDRS